MLLESRSLLSLVAWGTRGSKACSGQARGGNACGTPSDQAGRQAQQDTDVLRTPGRAQPTPAHVGRSTSGGSAKCASGDSSADATSCELFFARVPTTTSQEELEALFARFGRVTNLNLFRAFAGAKHSKGCGIVSFEAAAAAAAAKAALHNTHVWAPDAAAMVVENVNAGKKRNVISKEGTNELIFLPKFKTRMPAEAAEDSNAQQQSTSAGGEDTCPAAGVAAQGSPSPVGPPAATGSSFSSLSSTCSPMKRDTAQLPQRQGGGPTAQQRGLQHRLAPRNAPGAHDVHACGGPWARQQPSQKQGGLPQDVGLYVPSFQPLHGSGSTAAAPGGGGGGDDGDLAALAADIQRLQLLQQACGAHGGPAHPQLLGSYSSHMKAAAAPVYEQHSGELLSPLPHLACGFSVVPAAPGLFDAVGDADLRAGLHAASVPGLSVFESVPLDAGSLLPHEHLSSMLLASHGNIFSSFQDVQPMSGGCGSAGALSHHLPHQGVLSGPHAGPWQQQQQQQAPGHLGSQVQHGAGGVQGGGVWQRASAADALSLSSQQLAVLSSGAAAALAASVAPGLGACMQMQSDVSSTLMQREQQRLAAQLSDSGWGVSSNGDDGYFDLQRRGGSGSSGSCRSLSRGTDGAVSSAAFASNSGANHAQQFGAPAQAGAAPDLAGATPLGDATGLVELVMPVHADALPLLAEHMASITSLSQVAVCLTAAEGQGVAVKLAGPPHQVDVARGVVLLLLQQRQAAAW